MRHPELSNLLEIAEHLFITAEEFESFAYGFLVAKLGAGADLDIDTLINEAKEVRGEA